jgi:PQQ-like domain
VRSLLFIGLLVVLVDSGCRSPTEISVTVVTDVPCKDMRGASITVGTPGTIDTALPTVTTTTCDPDTGVMGTLVVVPSNGDNAEIAIRVVGGVGVDPESCIGTTWGSGCIVARRALRYLPHQPLHIPVRLSSTCQGIVCAPNQTCSLGVCKQAAVDPNQCTSNQGCGDGTLGDGGSSNGPAILVEGCGDVSGLQANAPWPVKGRCNTRMSRSTVTGPAKVNVKWTAPLDVKTLTCPPEIPQFCDVGGPVIAADGTIYTGGGDGLYAFTSDGTRKWKTPLPRQVIVTPAIASSGLVIAPCLDGNLYAISPGGAVVWSFKADSALDTAPAIAPDHTIYFTSVNGTLYAINEDGSLRWSNNTGNPNSDVALSLDANVLYVGGKDRFYSVNPKTGVHGWDLTLPNYGFASVAMDQTVYIESGSSSQVVTPNGILLYETADGAGEPPVPLPNGNAIFTSSNSHAWYARDRSGKEVWNFVTSAPSAQSVVVGGDGKVYGNDIATNFSVLDANGKLVDSINAGKIDNPSPSALAMGADGTLYQTQTDGRLVAFHE